jgi:hypothetical protein
MGMWPYNGPNIMQMQLLTSAKVPFHSKPIWAAVRPSLTILGRRDQPVNGITGQAVFDHFEKTVVEPTEEKGTLADPSTFRRIIWVTVVLDEFDGVRVGPYVLTDIMVCIDGGTRVRAGSGVMVPWAASKS